MLMRLALAASAILNSGTPEIKVGSFDAECAAVVTVHVIIH